MNTRIQIYDTTLRDGSQGEGVHFSLQDKIRIARRLDEAGFHFIEGGWPGSNPKDLHFFEAMRKVSLKHAKLAAFGMTRRKDRDADKDENVLSYLNAETSVVTLVGKSWDLHVTEALKVDMATNLDMIGDTVRFIKSEGREVVYDAEHFFDGYKGNPGYAMQTIRRAMDEGADIIVLCDTNGGTLPDEVARIVRQVKEQIAIPIGIHTHNDCDLGVANALAAVANGATHVQGTVNGVGERCGNADLIAIIANLSLKMGYRTIGENKIQRLTDLSMYVYETANLVPRNNQAFVGSSAFAHKGGMHVSAVRRNPMTYEHIRPEAVGNGRRILISELSGRTTVLAKVRRLDAEQDGPYIRDIIAEVQDKENAGYHFEAAEASFDLLVRRRLGEYKKFFTRAGFRVIAEKRDRDDVPITEASIKLMVHDRLVHCVAEGDGPVDALARALRSALVPSYPSLDRMHLIDYKVRIIDAGSGTAAKVRVIIECRDGSDVWRTIGVSENIIEASWLALVDSVEYKLLKDEGAKTVTG